LQTIDSLVVVLGLDPSQFNEAQREALEAFKKTKEGAVASGKEIDTQGKKTSEFFSVLKREALGLLGMYFAGKGIKDFIGYITDLDASTGRLAGQFHVSQENLLAWRNVMKQVGSDAGAADATISSLSDTMQDFLLNPSKANPELFGALARVGVNPEDYTDPLKVLHGLAKLSQTPEFKNDEPHFRAEAKLVGVTDPGMISALFEGEGALNKRLEDARKAVGHPNTEEAKQFQTNMALMQDSAASVGRVLVNELLPPLNELMKLITKLNETGLPDWLADSIKWVTKDWTPTGEPTFSNMPLFPPSSTPGLDKWGRPLPTEGQRDSAVKSIVKSVMGPKTVEDIWGKGSGIEMLVGAGSGAGTINHRSYRQRATTFHNSVHIEHMHIPNAKDGAQAAVSFANKWKEFGFSADSGAN
jgi:hypothetical protein